MLLTMNVLRLERQMILFYQPRPAKKLYHLSLHDALPICHCSAMEIGEEGIDNSGVRHSRQGDCAGGFGLRNRLDGNVDRKSTRLNSSHPSISYAVFCLKKKS